MKFIRPALVLILAMELTTPARAWDPKGHRIVAAIAWDHMDPGTRTRAAALLRTAPSDSALLDEDTHSTLPPPERDRQLFLRAATWPDIIRAALRMLNDVYLFLMKSV